MNEYLLKMLSIEKDIEKNKKKQTIIRSVAVLCVFMVFFCSFNPDTVMNIAFFVSLPVIIALFVVDSNFAGRVHSLEVDIYLLELEHLKKEREAKEEEGKSVSENWQDSLVKPNDKPALPYVFYFVLIVIDVIIWII
ncbi:MAG: hypothetical protein IJL55_09560 [Lachnospiraceae bacterium]|nr:hypothetical protein [Lachnospiraceae bacterium]